MLRIGIIGCGRIADQHATEICRLGNCEIVGVCDKEPLLAKQLCERFDIPADFTDVNRFLEIKPLLEQYGNLPLERIFLESVSKSMENLVR